jgi:methionyl-tRNA synthetase
MLMAEGSYQLPWQVVVNAFLNIKFPDKDEEKISKSRGTAIWINDYLKRFDPDPLRYYLTAIAPETSRTTFEVDDFITRNNNELSNALGNFINRTLTFAARYFDGRVPEPGHREQIDEKQLALLPTQTEKIAEQLSHFRFKAGLAELMALARAANVYFDAKEPWKQRKDAPAACGVTINVCLQTVKTLMTVMAPFLPFSAKKTAGMLGLDFGDSIIPWSEALIQLPPGHILGEPVILYRKIKRDEFID